MSLITTKLAQLQKRQALWLLLIERNFLKVSYVLTLLINSMFSCRTWSHNSSRVMVRMSELFGYIIGIHFLTQPTV
jgi:hypothetical protein